jgi:hypothetical protein
MHQAGREGATVNKYQRLIKQLTATGIKCAVALAVAGAIFAGASTYEDGVLQSKKEAEDKLKQDETLLATLTAQLDSTDTAQKKFIEMQGGRNIEDFSANFEAFQAFLKAAKDRYRLSIEILPAKEAVSDKPELKNFTHDVMVRPKVELTIKAISDLHIFSFISDMQRNAPGLIHVEKVTLKRPEKVDFTDQTYDTLKSGASPLLVEANIQLTWLRFVQKATKPDANSAPATP